MRGHRRWLRLSPLRFEMAFGVSPFLLSFVSKTVCFRKRQDHTAEFFQGAAFDPVEVCDVEGRDGEVM